jgi:hypothetical protein
VARSYDRCAVRSECCSATSEHTTRSGARQPAVGVRETSLQERCRKTPGDCRHYAQERRCIRVNRYHGGLTPPALVLVYERLPAKKRFLRCTNAHPARSGARQPAVARSYDRCAARSECCSATSEHTTRSSDRQPAVGVGNALARALPLSHGGPPTVYVRIAVAFALIVPTGSLRQPLLVARTDIVGDARLRFATAFCFARGVYAPRSCVVSRTLVGERRGAVTIAPWER